MGDEPSEERKARDIGRDSPASEEAKEQGMSGDRGAAQAQIEGTPRQPPQASGRAPAARFQQPAEERKDFAPGQAPSEQGEKDHPRPEMIKQNQQGAAPRSGSHSAHGERTEAEAQRGDPAGEHARQGRRHEPGTRTGHRSEG